MIMRVVELLIASFFIFSGFDAGASDVKIGRASCRERV